MAFPYRRILNPVDFEENSVRAAEVAAALARQNDGAVFLLHVFPMVPPPAGPPPSVQACEAKEDRMRAELEQIARNHLGGARYELLTRVGGPAAEILKAATTLAADLIVMATHGRTGFSRAFFGSIAEDVLREAPCPVLTVHLDQADRRRSGVNR